MLRAKTSDIKHSLISQWLPFHQSTLVLHITEIKPSSYRTSQVESEHQSEKGKPCNEIYFITENYVRVLVLVCGCMAKILN